MHNRTDVNHSVDSAAEGQDQGGDAAGVARRVGGSRPGQAPGQYHGGAKYQPSDGAFLDYFAGTFPLEEVPPDALFRLLQDQGVKLDHGRSGYTDVWMVLGDGWIGVNPDRPDMGVHLELPGRALDALRLLSGFETDRQICCVFGGIGIKSVSRLDIACDDTEGTLDLSAIATATKSREMVTRWKRGKVYDNLDFCQGGVDAPAVAFGSPGSRAYLRIYDKRGEQMQRGGVASEQLPEQWIRVEVQFRRENAEAAFWRIVDEGGIDWFGSVLLSYLDFKTPSIEDSNKSRWVSVAWWVAFCGSIKTRLQTAMEKVAVTVERAKNWIDRQVAPTLAFLLEAEGGDVAWLRGVMAAARDRLSISQRAALRIALAGVD